MPVVAKLILLPGVDTGDASGRDLSHLQAAAYQPPSKCKLKHASARQRLCNKVVQGYVNMEFGQSVLGFLRFSMVAGLNT